MSVDINEGYFDATVSDWGLTETKNGHPQFAIECAIEVPDEASPEGIRVVHLTKFCGLAGEGLQYTVQDMETCGWAGADIAAAELERDRKVRVHVIIDGQYGPKLKSIFPPGGAGGALIRKQAMGEAKKAAISADVNSQIAALRAKRTANGGAPPRTSSTARRPQAARAVGQDFGGTGQGEDKIPF